LRGEGVNLKALLLRKRRGETAKIVSIAVGLLVLAVLFPVAMSQIVSANTSGWNSAVAVVFSTLTPVLAIIGAALLFFKGGFRR
jgi:hypothetical protein